MTRGVDSPPFMWTVNRCYPPPWLAVLAPSLATQQHSHCNCYPTTNYEEEGAMWKQSRCCNYLSVTTVTVFSAIVLRLERSQDIQGDTCDMAWHSPLHKHPVAVPALDIISITPKGRNKTTVITIQHRPFLQRGGSSVGMETVWYERRFLRYFLFVILTCGARSRYWCVHGSFEAPLRLHFCERSRIYKIISCQCIETV